MPVEDDDLVLFYYLLTTHSSLPSSYLPNMIELKFLVSSVVLSVYIIITF